MQKVRAGLIVWANALHALQRLGLEEILRQVGKPYEGTSFRTPHGTVLAETSVRVLGQPLAAVHWADLQGVLLREREEEAVQFGACSVGYQLDMVVTIGRTSRSFPRPK
ncbi:MAG TPA: hypothetical protein VGN34_05115 [Ktedonobacteraceae bacterium]